MSQLQQRIKQNLYTPGVYILRLLVTAGLTLVVFLSLPVLKALSGNANEPRETERVSENIIMEVSQEREVERKVEQKKRLRSMEESRLASKGVSTAPEIAPDLGVGGEGPGVSVGEESLESAVFEKGEVDESVVPLSVEPIQYPKRAVQADIEGVLRIEFVINTEGKPESIKIIELPHEVFREPVLRTVKQWRFKPARKEGVEVNQIVRKEIEFKLNQ
ncbi:MAG: energy transducer TonB [Chitinivibrionales bacterium]